MHRFALVAQAINDIDDRLKELKLPGKVRARVCVIELPLTPERSVRPGGAAAISPSVREQAKEVSPLGTIPWSFGPRDDNPALAFLQSDR
jgi:hypothetical protein